MRQLQESQIIKYNHSKIVLFRFLCFFIIFSTISSGLLSAPNQNEMLPMGDSVLLRTQIYLPSDSGKFPVILIRTPYTGAWLEIVASAFTDNNYVTVIQFIRGMGESDGQFIPFVNEHSDGIITLEWLKEQSWCDGRVALWGVSYLSFCSFEVARAQDPAVKSMINISGWADLNNFITRGGALRLLDQLPWLMTYSAGQSQIPDQAWYGIFRTTPLSQFFQQSEEEVSAAIAIPYDYSKITIPTLHITGWNDYVCRNTLEAYHQSKSNSQLTQESKLVIGPWTHNQVFDPDSTKYGDADFGESSRMGIDSILSLSVSWFDEHVKMLLVENVQSSPVTYFTQGANLWHSSSDWPPTNTSKENWYLTFSDGESILQSPIPTNYDSLEFSYDPDNPVPTIGGPVSYKHPFNVGIKSQSSLEDRKDILFFESEVLKLPIELAGSISVILYASTDSLDTDFTAKLVEVRSNGYARMIEDGIIRARYNRSTDSAIFSIPRTIQRYEIDLGETAYQIAAGSKLRLEISSGNFPKFDRNPNDGTDPFLATQFRIAHQKIFMSAMQPSKLILTVVNQK